MLKLFISMAALFLGVGSSVFAQIEGKVYIDANGNGIVMRERGAKRSLRTRWSQCGENHR